MFKRLLPHRWFQPTISLCCLLAGCFLTTTSSVYAQSDTIVPNDMAHGSVSPRVESFESELETDPQIDPFAIPDDPLDSPYPVPWKWLIETQGEFSQKQTTGSRYYRSQALVSPDGKYAAYTRIQLTATPELYQSRVTSVMFVENLETGELQVIRADSPLAKELKAVQSDEEIPGIMSILMPVSWSENGDRLLSRQLEGFFNTSDASDYGVIWERKTNETKTVTPSPDSHNTSILLGWNHDRNDEVLFKTGSLGEENWPVASVTPNGKVFLANNPESITYGKLMTQSWTGNQTLY
ncbi:hypothetical protein PCC8801_0108 [Rippkaea orientalis PCC 8801]|uniref:WD40 domain protein beta Propeller n=1 Tax=Rippkaea orientalis (strain PCC 8801 / RF-1) TaxID=41431 RepID=B7K0R0_RIPO1|nr:hypothetical protein [Rippkaea orientalis]ACK64214.1 hypothetical protein PCC8801_0108 [Rippkaea orientalis PCC 8801]